MKRGKRRTNLRKALIFSVILVAFVSASVGCASAAIHYVNPGELIQAAVTAANSSDTIIVRDGTYIENIDINKRLTIQSENGSENCIVNASNPNDHVFAITVDYVNISGFTIIGVTGFLKSGIYLGSVDYCNISNNRILNSGTHECGIYLGSSSSHNIINNNYVSDSDEYGIYIESGNSYNEIANNIIVNVDESISFHSSCSNNNVTNNTIINDGSSGRAIVLNGGSSNNRITRNTMISNMWGVSFNDGCGNNNVIYLNNFINSTINHVFTGCGALTNIWNSTEKINYTYNGTAYTNYMGNYWDNYTDVDTNNDGIWETSYTTPDTNSDGYPLVEPWEKYFVPPEPPEPPTPIPIFTYTGDVLPSADGWIAHNYPSYESTCAHVEDGVLHLNDPNTYSGSALSYMREWPTSPDYINVAEFDLKVVSCSGIPGVLIVTIDDDHNMGYILYPDRIQSRYGIRYPDSSFDMLLGDVYYFDTTAQFNTYKAIIDNGTAKLYINGTLVLEQPAGTGTHRNLDSPEYAHLPAMGVEFGLSGSPTTGEVYVDEVRAYILEENVTNQTVSFNPSDVSISPNSTATLNLTLDNAPSGLSGYNISIALSNTSVAEITSLNFPSWVSIHSNSALPADSLWIKAADLGDQVKGGATNITLATLTLRGDTRGDSEILINVTKMDDDNGDPIEANTIAGQIEVLGVISFPGCDNLPTDPDSDGFYEDINGNGRRDFNDVVVFFNYLEWIEGNQPCTECFDFNENTYIDFDDIVELFNEV